MPYLAEEDDLADELPAAELPADELPADAESTPIMNRAGPASHASRSGHDVMVIGGKRALRSVALTTIAAGLHQHVEAPLPRCIVLRRTCKYDYLVCNGMRSSACVFVCTHCWRIHSCKTNQILESRPTLSGYGRDWERQNPSNTPATIGDRSLVSELMKSSERENRPEIPSWSEIDSTTL